MVFLAALVLAAYYMEEDGDRSGTAYFPQLREVLGIEEGEGRPPGLGQAQRAEEPLWLRWNRWLETKGWQPTARRGQGGGWTYIEYPLSQCLLRRTDHQRLARLFCDHAHERSWDRDQFDSHLPMLTQWLGATRLAGLLRDTSDRRRHEAVVDDAFEVFRSPWHDVEDFDAFIPTLSGPRPLEAGLYRLEDRRGKVEYFLYPRAPRQWRNGGLRVRIDQRWHALTLERDGWFTHLPEPIAPGERRVFAVNSGSEDLTQMILPGNSFWIFVPDPDGYTHDLATWGSPLEGEPFVLLAHDQLAQALQTLRQQEFLRWQGEPVAADFAGWSEYHDCQVSRFDWEEVPLLPNAEELLRALRPAGGVVRLSLEGGLSVPGQNVWLEGFPPSLWIRADAETAQFLVRRLSTQDNPIVQQGEVPTHTAQPLHIETAGEYRIEVTTALGRAERFVRVARWNQLELGPVHRPFDVSINENLRLRGACLLPPQAE